MKNKKIYIPVLLILLLIVSCKAPGIGHNEKYEAKGHEFQFFADSTFQYEHNDYCYSQSSGKWEKKGNSIILNSIIQNDKIPIEYTKVESKKDSIVIHVEVNSKDKPQRDYWCFPFINDQPCLFDPGTGSYSITHQTPITSIYFVIAKSPLILRKIKSKRCYDSVRSEEIFPDASLGDSLHISVDIIDSLFDYKVFKDKELKVKYGKIIYREDDEKYKLKLKKQE